VSFAILGEPRRFEARTAIIGRPERQLDFDFLINF
jgi:hypothetical protein